MYKITDYRTVTDRLSHLLDRKVTKLLDEGWELHGDQNSISFANRSDAEYSQVMIKRESPSWAEEIIGDGK